jgi:uncharacterized protein
MKKWQTAVIALIIIIIAVLTFYQYTKMGAETNLITDDGFKISYDYHYVSDKGVILIHMMNQNKNDMKNLADFLNKNGYSTISIDLRGHGKSQGKWQDFSEKDFQNMKYDLKAAKNFLVQKDINKISIIGASIGANLALNYSTSSDIRRIVLLSPGESYHGITTLNAIKKYNGAVLLISAKDDSESYSTTEQLNKNAVNSKFISYDTGGHGTYLLLSHPELQQTILEFLNNN